MELEQVATKTLRSPRNSKDISPTSEPISADVWSPTDAKSRPEIPGTALIDNAFILRMAHRARWLQRYFRASMHGWDNCPAQGPVLMVSNHNAGAPAEVFLINRFFRQAFGTRPARGLMHQVCFKWPMSLSTGGQRIGGMPADMGLAEQAIAEGSSVLVFPGGDEQVLRPFSQRYVMDFGARRGYLRLARKTRVPIVPIVFCGSHAIYIVLPGGGLLARLLGLRRLARLARFPLTLGVAWTALASLATAWSTACWPLIPMGLLVTLFPLPSRVTAQVLPAFYVGDDESDDQAAERLRLQMQAAMDAMARARKSPWG